MTHLRLLTWPVDFDPNCKFIATYLGFARKPFVIQYVTTSSVSVSGELPVIVSPMGTEVACGWEQCLEWLSLHGHDLNAHLTDNQQALTLAFSKILTGPLFDALLHNLWMDSENYFKNTRKAVSGSLPWLTRYFVVDALQNKAKSRLMRGNGVLDVEEIYKEASRLYKVLDEKLGHNEFLLGGDSPTSIDAMLYAHLSLAAQPNLANPRLFSLISFLPNLTLYISRMDALLVETTAQSNVVAPPPSALADLAQMIRSSLTGLDPRTWTTFGSVRKWTSDDWFKVVQVLSCVGLFVGFVIRKGIVQIGSSEDVVEDDHDEDFDSLAVQIPVPRHRDENEVEGDVEEVVKVKDEGDGIKSPLEPHQEDVNIDVDDE